MAVAVAAPVPAFELGVVCEAFGLDRTSLGLPGYDFAVCAERTGPVPTTSGFAVTPSHRLDRMATADLIIVLGADPPPAPPSAALSGQLARKGAKDPGALAASIGRKKYGKAGFAAMSKKKAK